MKNQKRMTWRRDAYGRWELLLYPYGWTETAIPVCILCHTRREFRAAVRLAKAVGYRWMRGMEKDQPRNLKP